MTTTELQGELQELFSGVLHKVGGKVKTWNRRFFVLKSDYCLYYYKDTNKGALGTITLKDPKFKARRGESKDTAWPRQTKLDCTMAIETSHRKYCVYCDYSHEIDEWIEQLSLARDKVAVQTSRSGNRLLPATPSSSSTSDVKEPASSSVQNEQPTSQSTQQDYEQVYESPPEDKPPHEEQQQQFIGDYALASSVEVEQALYEDVNPPQHSTEDKSPAEEGKPPQELYEDMAPPTTPSSSALYEDLAPEASQPVYEDLEPHPTSPTQPESKDTPPSTVAVNSPAGNKAAAPVYEDIAASEDQQPLYEDVLDHHDQRAELAHSYGESDDENDIPPLPPRLELTPPLPHRASAEDVNPPLPPRTEDINPPLPPRTEDVNPPLPPRTEDINPQVAEDINPQVAEDINPQVAEDINPQVAEDINPQVAEDINPQVAEDINPQVTEDINPSVPPRTALAPDHDAYVDNDIIPLAESDQPSLSTHPSHLKRDQPDQLSPTESRDQQSAPETNDTSLPADNAEEPISYNGEDTATNRTNEAPPPTAEPTCASQSTEHQPKSSEDPSQQHSSDNRPVPKPRQRGKLYSETV